ncbi:ATP-binding protein (plasmid) [Aggregatilineales bacterium SYSU G02658]
MSKQEPINVSFFERLLSISQQMARTRDLDPLLEYAIRSALELLNAERGYLMLVDPQGKRDFRVKLNRDGSVPQEEVSAAILNHVWQTHDPLIIYDAVTDPRLAEAASVRAMGLRSVMCAPLLSQGQLLGAIYLESRSTRGVFQQKDLEPLMMFANQVALSLEHVLLANSLEERIRQRTTELELAVKQLERAWLDAVEANRIRTMILANIAHDIRSPIGLSISALQTIREGAFGALTDRQITWIDRVLESLDHAISLTGDVFDLTKAELSGLQLNFEPIDMSRFMVHLSQLGEGIDWAPNVTFETRIPPNLPRLTIDATRIQQVVFNLLSNAQRFTVDGKVVLYAQARENDLLIGVRDSGIGVSPHQRETIFERFHQGEQETDSRFRGTGLGLAISKELVLLHGGQIWVESEVGQYSDFKFTLPITSPAR